MWTSRTDFGPVTVLFIQLSMSGDGVAVVVRATNIVFATGILVELIGIEPTTSGLQSQRSPN